MKSSGNIDPGEALWIRQRCTIKSNDQNHNIKSHSARLNEQLLLQRVSAGDGEACTYLFNYYLPKLFQYIYPFANQSGEVTEEIIQESFQNMGKERHAFIHPVFRKLSFPYG